MTSEEYDKLSDEEIRIKVAECAGKTCTCRGSLFGTGYTGCEIHDPDENNYLNDLNACHEFEDHLIATLHEAGWREYSSHFYGHTRPIRATARQRCKAFVLTMTAA